jgi:hypothetical protein
LPEQPIPACSSLEDIVSRTSEQLVVAAIAVQLIATRTTANDVVAAEAEDRVVSVQRAARSPSRCRATRR